MAEIDILIKAIDQASPAIKTVDSGLKNMGTAAHDTSGKMSGLQTVTSGLGNVLKAGLTTALVGAGAAIAGMAVFLKGSLDEARNQIEADKQLEQVIKSTGAAAGVTADQAKQLASSLSLVTNFGDDAIQSGESLLLTFTNIGKDVFPQATQTMLDMSQALGQDMKSSAIQLGKALNDPIQGLTALSRVGVSFTDQQKEMIKTMQDAGDVAGAQAVILGELSKEFGGSAQALADPAIQLKNAYGELQEGVGMLLVPILNQLAQTVLPYVQAATEAVGKVVSDFNQRIKEGEAPLQALKQAIYDALPPDLQARWDAISSSIQGTLNTILGNVQNTMGWIRLAWETDWGDIHTTWTNFATALPQEQETFWQAWRLVFNTNSKQNVNDWQGFFGDIFGFATSFWTLTLANFAQFGFALHAVNKLWLDLTKGDWRATWDDIKIALNAATEIILNNIEYVFGPGLRDHLATWLNATWEMLKTWWNNVSSWWSSGPGMLFGIIGGAPAGLPQLPQTTPSVPGQDNLSGGNNNATASASSLGGVSITQHFYGQTDPQIVNEAANNGVLTAARSMGLR